MKRNIKVNGSFISIELFVTVFEKSSGDIVDEGFENFRDAYYYFPRSKYRCEWTAARIIDEFGNTDFPVYGGSYIRKAISNLKHELS